MEKLIDRIIDFLQNLKKMDKEKLAAELKELGYFIKKQFFCQIPSVSAIAGIMVGSWVASTFTTSPIRGFLATFGIMKGGTRVVSSATYRFLSIVLPVISIAVTAYLVQKVLKRYREKRLAQDKAVVAGLGEEVQAEILGKIHILDKAKEAGLISEGEHETKYAMLYQSYVRTAHSKLKDFVINKIS